MGQATYESNLANYRCAKVRDLSNDKYSEDKQI